MKKIALSPVDALFLGDDFPVEFVCFYRANIAIAALRSALRELAIPFWPLFGRYVSGHLLERPYSEQSYLEEVTASAQFHVGSEQGLSADTLAALRAAEGEEGLFSLRVVRFEDGTALVARMSHLVGDAYSLFHFLSALARATAGKRDCVPSALDLPGPTHDRTVLRGVDLGGIDAVPRPARRNLSARIDTIPKAWINETLKSVVRAARVTVSVNDVLSALTLKRVVELQGDAPSAQMTLVIPIDVRLQIAAYGPAYFGNGLWLHRATFDRAEVARADIGTLALAIRASMPKITAQGYGEHLESLAPLARLERGVPRVYDSSSGCLVSNASQLSGSALDFGAGPPAHLFPILKERHSAMILADKASYRIQLAC